MGSKKKQQSTKEVKVMNTFYIGALRITKNSLTFRLLFISIHPFSAAYWPLENLIRGSPERLKENIQKTKPI